MPWTDVGFKRLCTDWIRDPQRLRQVCARIVETVVPAFLTLIWCVAWWAAIALACVIAAGEFVLYEFVLEPRWTWTGNYWERPPREGTTYIT